MKKYCSISAFDYLCIKIFDILSNRSEKLFFCGWEGEPKKAQINPQNEEKLRKKQAYEEEKKINPNNRKKQCPKNILVVCT
jgi:hypothetical protein